MLTLALRICGVDCLDRQRFISQSLPVNFAYNFRTNFIAAGSKFEFLSGAAGKSLKARLRVRYDLAVHDEGHRIHQKVGRNADLRHSMRRQKAASNDDVKWAFDQTAHQPFDFLGVRSEERRVGKECRSRVWREE